LLELTHDAVGTDGSAPPRVTWQFLLRIDGFNEGIEMPSLLYACACPSHSLQHLDGHYHQRSGPPK